MKTEKLGNIIKLTKGKKHLETDDINASRYLQIEDVNGSDNIKYTAEKGVQVNSYDIILVWDGANAGKVGIGLNGVIGSTLSRMAIDNKAMYPKYLYWFLQSKFDFIKNQRNGATIPHVSSSSIKSLPIPIFTLTYQQRIATILDHADSIRRKNRLILEKYNELAQSVFYEMFGDPFHNPKNWRIQRINDIASSEKNAIKAGPFGSSLKKEFYVSSGYKIYGQEQVIKDDFNYGNYYINNDLYKKLETCKIKEGDILISLVGSYGLISIVPKVFEPGIINPRLMKISLDQKVVNAVFFKYLLQSKGIRTKIENSTHGGTMEIVNVGIMKDIEVPIPPLTLQEKFVEILQSINDQKSLTQKSLEKSEELFQSLLQRAFKGEL